MKAVRKAAEKHRGRVQEIGQHYLVPTSSHLPIHSKALRYGPKVSYTYPGIAPPALPWGC